MSHPRALTEQQAIEAEQWFAAYERVGTIGSKCRELGISPHTLYDTIRRVRGQLTRTTRQKLSAHELEQLVNAIHERTSNVEHASTMEEESAELKAG